MSGVQQRLKLKQTPIDTWSLKEHLTLASAVLKNGDQNWVSVSRTMKQLGEPGRPGDWFKDKNCALQYNLLLEKADIPTRKRGEKGDNESPAESIVKKLSQERIVELQRIVEEERKDILKMEEETELLSSDDITEEQLQKILKQVEKEEEEEDEKERQHIAWLQQREEKKLAIQAALRPGVMRLKPSGGPSSLTQMTRRPSSLSQSEQSGSEQDSAVDSPIACQGGKDSDNNPTVDVESLTAPPPPPPTSKVTVPSSPTSTSPLLSSILQSPTRLPTTTVLTPSVTTLSPVKNSPPPTSPKAPLKPQPTEILNTNTEPAVPPSVVEKSTDDVEVKGVQETPESVIISDSQPELEVFIDKEVDFDQVMDIDSSADAIDLKETLSDLDELLKGEMEDITSKTEDDLTMDTIQEVMLKSILEESGGGSDDTTAQPIDTVEEIVKTEVIEANPDEDFNKKEEVSVEEPSLNATEQEIEVKTEKKVRGRPKIRKEDFVVKLDECPVTEQVIKADIKEEESPIKSDEQDILESDGIDTKSVKIEKEDLTFNTEAETHKDRYVITSSTLNNIMTSPKPSSHDDSSSRDTSPVIDISLTTMKDTDVTADPSDEDMTNDETGNRTPVKNYDEVDSAPPSPHSQIVTTPRITSPVPPICHTLFTDSMEIDGREKEYRSWKKSIVLVWSQIAQHKNASLFAGPVSEADAPVYRDIVYRSMDLGSVKKNIESGHIRTTEEFQRDLSLMFFNAIMYNSSDHEVYNLTCSMQIDTNKIVQEYLNTQALLKSNEPKSLRKTETSPYDDKQRSRSVSGGCESPVSSRQRTTSSCQISSGDLIEKRKRTSSQAEDSQAKKRRL